jgi:diketogulonate reductase-like aldo/keto reductase
VPVDVAYCNPTVYGSVVPDIITVMTAIDTQRIFGSTHRPVAAVGQGSWRADEADASQAVAAMQRGIDLGLTHIDTAEMYGAGAAERIVGRAIVGRRDAVFLVSKVLPSNASRRGTLVACEKSLANLRTDRLDCYLLHWRGSHPLEETLAAFDLLLRAGKILSWGVSNFDVTDLEEIAAIAGPGHPACNQVLYHLQERAIEHAVVPWCQEHGSAVVAYTPFGESPAAFDRQTAHGRVLCDIAQMHGATARQVALGFLLRTPEVFVIPKASDLPHVADNAAAASLVLSAEELARIDAAFPRGARKSHLPMI